MSASSTCCGCGRIRTTAFPGSEGSGQAEGRRPIVTTTTTLCVRDTIDRALTDEPQTIVRVYETANLRTDFKEYVLTDQLAGEFAKVLERVIESARPAGGG